MEESTVTEATEDAPADKHRRLAVIMFTDIEGSTVLVRQLGQERAREIVGHHNELLKTCIVEQGAGSIEKFTGDGVFATFEHPSDAISCALRIQRGLNAFSEQHSLSFPFRIRIGLHLGEIVFGTESAGEIVSQHINFAARVMGVADGGQILTTVGVYEAARGFEFDEPTEHLAWANHGEFNLKGIGLVELHEITDKRIRRPEPPSSAAEIKHPANLRRIESKGYGIHSRIGQGSMGIVYLAETPETDNSENSNVVAIKVLASTLEDDPEARERFTRESKVISTLDHPGIISINQVHTEDSPPFFTMEWIEGKPITEAAEGLNWESKAELIAKVCDALDHAHQHSVVHRDLKPSNILVKTGGHPVILDFGLSMAFDPSASPGISGSSSGIIGTPLYLSPEQAESEENIGPAADIYSMGAILHEVITGEPPFVGPSVREILDAHVHEDPALPSLKNPEIPDALQRICLMALEKDPNDRYPSTLAMAEDLRRFAQGDPVLTRPRLYDNLVRNRANRHKNEVGRWFKDRLITPFEHAAIIFAYRRLVRGGTESLMESRLLKAGVLLLYLAGWFIVNGTAIWLTQHWGEGFLDERWVRIAVGVSPAVLANSLWGLFFRRGSFQRAYVMMIVGIVAMPLALGIILFESADAFELAFLSEAWWYDKQTTLFSSKQGITNSQLFINFSLCSLWGAWVAWRTRTVAASGLTVVFIILLAQVIIDFKGLMTFFQHADWASFALYQFPLFTLLVGAGYLLAERFNRRDQCIPWFVGAFLIVITASQSMAVFGPDEWLFRDWKADNRAYGKYVKLEASEIETKSAQLNSQIVTRTAEVAALEKELEQTPTDGAAKDTVASLRKRIAAEKRKLKTGQAERDTLVYVFKEYRMSFRATDWFQKQIVRKGLRPGIGLAEILAGLGYLFIGLMLRQKMAVEALPAYTLLIWLSPIAVLGGLTYMDVNWPKSWFQFNIFGQTVPPASLVLLAIAVSTVLLASKLQSRIFVLVGLGFTAYTLWLLGARYLLAEDAWPITVLLTGLVVTMLVVIKEFRKPPIEEIDPLASGS